MTWLELLWWLIVGSVKIVESVRHPIEIHVVTAFIATSIATLAWLGRQLKSRSH